MRIELHRGINDNRVIADGLPSDAESFHSLLAFVRQQFQSLCFSLILTEKIDLQKEEILLQWAEEGILKELFLVGQAQNIHSKLSIRTHSYSSINQLLLESSLVKSEEQLLILKGGLQNNLNPVLNKLVAKGHLTKLEVDLQKVLANFQFYRSMLKPQTKIMAVIKAFAYGSGIVEIARFLENQGADYFAVAYTDEGIALRKAGIRLPIMVLNANLNDADLFMRYDLEPELYSLKQLAQYTKDYNNSQRKLKVHIMLNTGMNRLGFSNDELTLLIKTLRKTELIKVQSICSHLAASDDPKEERFTLSQIEAFETGADQIAEILPERPLYHILNSGGISRYPQFQFDMVRLGIGIHGVEVANLKQDGLKTPARLSSVISQIREVKAGETIGYGRKGKALEDMKIAVIAIGYADGYSRQFSQGNAYMMIRGKKAKTVGNVCMDMTMVDVTNVDAQEGDEVIVFGSKPSIQDLAEWSGTIPYEILTNISSRVKRVFFKEY